MTAAYQKTQPALSVLHRLVLTGVLCLVPGCFRVTAMIPDTVPTDRHSQWVNGFFFGAFGGNVDAARFCGGRPISSIETKRSPGNYLIEFLTLGIYTPSHVSVTCGQPRWGGPGYANGIPNAFPNPYANAYVPPPVPAPYPAPYAAPYPY
jgi:hypothetical protein